MRKNGRRSWKEKRGRGLVGPDSRHRCCCVHCKEVHGCTSAECSPFEQTCTRFGGSRKDYSRTELASASNLPTAESCDSTMHRRHFRGNLHSFFNTTTLKLMSRMHLKLLQAAQFSHFLLANSLRKRWTQAKIVTSLVISLLLFSALVPSTTALQDYRQKSHSSSTFERWIIDDVESDSKTTPDILEHRRRLPDFVLPVNKLFHFELPGDAFGNVEVTHHYQVCRVLLIL